MGTSGAGGGGRRRGTEAGGGIVVAATWPDGRGAPGTNEKSPAREDETGAPLAAGGAGDADAGPIERCFGHQGREREFRPSSSRTNRL